MQTYKEGIGAEVEYFWEIEHAFLWNLCNVIVIAAVSTILRQEVNNVECLALPFNMLRILLKIFSA